MADHELMHAVPAMYNSRGGGGGGAGSHHGWWSSTGFSTWPSALAVASYNVAAAAKTSSESPGNNSSITFQEPTTIPDRAAGFTDWNHPFMNGTGAGSHGSFLQVGQQENMSSPRNDHQSHMNDSSLINPSSNNRLDLTLQGHHEQQLLSNLGGAELLLSPTSYGFQSSVLIRSLMEPAVEVLSDEYQQQYQQMGGKGSPAVAGTEPLQFSNNDAPFSNTSAGLSSMTAMATAHATNQPSGARTAKPSPAPFKKPRLETPSTLPTFKVRKEKLGDRVTALQQLVSPFGKTDTASVLHETIEYINFLHDQVTVLSSPYLKNGHHHQQHQVYHQYICKNSSTPDKSCKDGEVSLKGLQGLCLVPISTTFAVAGEVPVDFWTPFAANFR